MSELGMHHRDALLTLRQYLVRELLFDEWAPEQEKRSDNLAWSSIQQHMMAVRAVQAIDIACNSEPDPNEYATLRNSAVWAISTIGDDNADKIIASETLLDKAKVIGYVG
jgi:hypothetical protein